MKSNLEQLQQDMKKRLLAEKVRKEKEREEKQLLIKQTTEQNSPPKPPDSDRPTCISCKKRVAREGSVYCSRCSISNMVDNLRNTLPNSSKPLYRIYGTENGGSRLIGESETLEEAVEYFHQNEASGNLFGIKYPDGKWHRFGEKKVVPISEDEEVAPNTTLSLQPRLPIVIENKNEAFIETDGKGGIRRSQVAKMLGISPTTLIRWERKGYIPEPIRVRVSQIDQGQCLYTEEMVEKAKQFMAAQYHAEQAHTPVPEGTPQYLSTKSVKKTIKLNRRMEKAVGRLLR